jgi:hypothetical protein
MVLALCGLKILGLETGGTSVIGFKLVMNSSIYFSNTSEITV